MAKQYTRQYTREFFVAQGRKGGLIGGPKRARRLTAKRRQAIARKAGRLGGLATQRKRRQAALPG